MFGAYAPNPSRGEGAGGLRVRELIARAGGAGGLSYSPNECSPALGLPTPPLLDVPTPQQAGMLVSAPVRPTLVALALHSFSASPGAHDSALPNASQGRSNSARGTPPPPPCMIPTPGSASRGAAKRPGRKRPKPLTHYPVRVTGRQGGGGGHVRFDFVTAGCRVICEQMFAYQYPCKNAIIPQTLMTQGLFVAWRYPYLVKNPACAEVPSSVTAYLSFRQPWFLPDTAATE